MYTLMHLFIFMNKISAQNPDEGPILKRGRGEEKGGERIKWRGGEHLI